MPRTLTGIFLDAVERYRKPAQFVRHRGGAWQSIAADAALAEVESLALGLRALGVERGDRVAILSETRYEWAVADLAILGLGAVTVPLYASSTAEQCRFILENSDAAACIVSSPAQLAKLRGLAGRLPGLRHVVHMEPAVPPPGAGPALEVAWDELVRRGAEARAREPGAYRALARAVGEGDLATIVYTSGTTGEPKGAMLTHGNIGSNVDACLDVIGLGPRDTCLSFLPLSHIFERMAGLYSMLAGGVTIAYARNMDTVAEDAPRVRPSVLMGVPRFYEKVYARAMANAQTLPPLKRRLFFWGLEQGTAKARARFEGQRLPWPAAARAALADRLVGSKIRARFGGRLRLCISGGAPLAPGLMEFFFAMGIPVVEGYGLTETSPVICLNRLGHERPGSVGPPIPGVEIRIGAEGEILTRGPNVMQGYYRNEEATRAALRDGWFHTGDIGRLEADGSLYITDRLKDLIVTAGGKKVAPQPLEAKLKDNPWVSEAVLLGDRQPYVVCLIVPEFAKLEAEAKLRGWSAAGRRELLARPEVRTIYQAELDRVNAGLASFEQVKKFALLDRELTQDAGELTPSLKIRRRIVTEHFAREIGELYAAPRPQRGG